MGSNSPQTIFAGSASNSNAQGVPPSRLLTNSTEIRNSLSSRNLYTPDVEYPLMNQNNIDRTVAAINSIIGGLTPFKTFNLKNTVVGRLVTNSTPLTEIGLIMLGKQFALNSMSYTSKNVLPVIKVSNLFDGNKDTKFITLNKDNRITKKDDANFFQRFLDTVTYFYPNRDNPFSRKSTNDDFIKNTGTGQLSNLYNAVNQNMYKFDKGSNMVFYDYAKNADIKIQPRSAVLGGDDKNVGTGDDDRKFFDFNNQKFYPYQPLNISDDSVLFANQSEYQSLITQETGNGSKTSSEYALSLDFVIDNFGTADKTKPGSLDDPDNAWIDTDVEFINDNIQNKLVWGRDGNSPTLKGKLSPLYGDTDHEKSNYVSQPLSSFNVKGGLLSYTRNLTNATDGQMVDITRKAFVKNKNLVGFNGAGLWKSNSSAYSNSIKNPIANKKGVRQHNLFDQYDRFAKAIRFDGNNVYGGNINSVIYDSVIPRYHPTYDANNLINNKNLMFSIENLAVRVYRDETNNVGIIDDEFGSVIPLEEAGPFNGRLMWFAPYDISINETASARYESTVMVGRNEPIYNYQNSERTANISFLLLIDHPEQLKNYRDNTGGQQRNIAEFFAFGGDEFFEDIPIKVPDAEKRIKDNEDKIKTFEPPPESEPLPPNITKEFKIYFPNDEPTDSQVNTIVDTMFQLQYEINDSVLSRIVADNTHDSLNNSIYFITGLTKSIDGFYDITTAYPQYNQAGVDGQEINGVVQQCLLNKTLLDIFGNDNLRPYYDITIFGASSKLFLGTNEKAYNDALGLRRAQAAKKFIEDRLKAVLGTAKANDIIGDGNGANSRIVFDSNNRGTIGSSNADPALATPLKMYEIAAKQERYAIIKIARNSQPVLQKTVVLSDDDKATVDSLRNENDKLRSIINKQKNLSNNLYNTRTLDATGANDGAILHGFKSVSGNYFYPAFHSQTPQDLHKRLTFLHQCTRQGAAKRYDTQFDSNGVLRARNSVFGRQPICIMRVGDLYYTKVVIESMNIEFVDNLWDMNPEGFGLQPMMAKITLQMKLIGGQSLKGPIDALQNAVTYNYYANSTFGKKNIFNENVLKQESLQSSYINGILTKEQSDLKTAFNNKMSSNAATNATTTLGSTI